MGLRRFFKPRDSTALHSYLYLDLDIDTSVNFAKRQSW